jgi:steroid delta-isomerase-like uncharacterized protein
MVDPDGIEALTERIERYNEAWNSQDLSTIVAMHAVDMVFANHTAGESAEGEEVREHIAKIFESWPEMRFATRRLYVRVGLVAQEWTATATHSRPLHRGQLVAPPSGRTVSWEGIDSIPFENGLIKRKDVYSDSVSILRIDGQYPRWSLARVDLFSPGRNPPTAASIGQMTSDFRPMGVFVPLVTPFDENREVDLGALESLTREVLDAGAHGVVALATTGERSHSPRNPTEVEEHQKTKNSICPVEFSAGHRLSGKRLKRLRADRSRRWRLRSPTADYSDCDRDLGSTHQRHPNVCELALAALIEARDCITGKHHPKVALACLID